MIRGLIRRSVLAGGIRTELSVFAGDGAAGTEFVGHIGVAVLARGLVGAFRSRAAKGGVGSVFQKQFHNRKSSEG